MYARSCASWKAFEEGKCNQNEVALFGEGVSMDGKGVFYLKLLLNDTSLT